MAEVAPDLVFVSYDAPGEHLPIKQRYQLFRVTVDDVVAVTTSDGKPAAQDNPTARTVLFMDIAVLQSSGEVPQHQQFESWVANTTGLTAALGKPLLASVYKDPNEAFTGWGYPSVIRVNASTYQMMYQGGTHGRPVGTLFSATSADGVKWSPISNAQQHPDKPTLPSNAIALPSGFE